MACSRKSEDSRPRLLPRRNHSARLPLRQPEGREANRAWSCHSVDHQGWLNAHLDRHNTAIYMSDSHQAGSSGGEGVQSCEDVPQEHGALVIMGLQFWTALSSMTVEYVTFLGVVSKSDVHFVNASGCSH